MYPAFSPGVKRSEYEVDHTTRLPNLRISGAVFAPPVCLHGVDRDSVTFTMKAVIPTAKNGQARSACTN